MANAQQVSGVQGSAVQPASSDRAVQAKPAAAQVKASAAVDRSAAIRVNPALEAQRARLSEKVTPDRKAKLKEPIRLVLEAASKKTVTGEELLDVAKKSVRGALGELPAADIEALAFLVMMEAQKAAREDLKAIIESVKAVEDARGCRRDAACLRALSAKSEMSKRAADKAIEDAKNGLDSLSEMGEMESLRLQMAMDRMSKMMSTLSNLLKKISDTSQSITQNLK